MYHMNYLPHLSYYYRLRLLHQCQLRALRGSPHTHEVILYGLAAPLGNEGVDILQWYAPSPYDPRKTMIPLA